MILQFNFHGFIRNLFPESWSDGALDLIALIGQIAIVSLIFYLVKQVIDYVFSERFPDRLQIKTSRTSPQRIKTLNAIVKNAFVYILYFVYIYILLTLLGIPIGTLLAGAGIAGVAIGLGAQELITDVINGFFIIFENQYEVEDWIELPDQGLSGEVLSLGIRTTSVKAASGEIYYIPNSEISIVNNQSRSKRQINIDLPVHDETDISNIESVTQKISNDIYEKYSEVIVEEPTTVGFVRGVDQTFNYRIAYNVVNGEQYMLESAFYREYLLGFQQEGIKIPSSVYDEN